VGIKTLSETKMLQKSKELGASLVEYALLVALIAVVALVGVRVLGQNVSTQFSNISTQIGG
jgi:pilus assembly protein Flp/PilA